MIKKPTQSPSVEFEDDSGNPHSIKATVLNHLYGEARESAKKLEGLTEPLAEPRSITVYSAFGQKINEHIKSTVCEETVFLIAGEMESQMSELKKTCIVSANSPSLESLPGQSPTTSTPS